MPRGSVRATHGPPGFAGVAGRGRVRHADFEWVALYPSRAAMEAHPWRPAMGQARWIVARGTLLTDKRPIDLRSMRPGGGNVREWLGRALRELHRRVAPPIKSVVFVIMFSKGLTSVFLVA